ncbi:hypothetical protein BpHYR1_048436 [Brachionus plicatilis]|uniref:Uncharacterized protein n=1 Tax=Brachionus plicatilis TaxID=10195 RepID=A0A3M7SRU2_BRAPC|nr:hypothetical protein BpHYR1_048436 [Brachionus plicatilis]
MEQPSSGLSAPSAYDLACRYNSLFQYSPAAAAACAAAYNMFGSSKSATMGSSNSPFQPLGSIATSSLPSSSSSNLTSSPTSSLSSLLSTKPTVVEQHDASHTKTNGNQSYENVSENGSASDNDNDEDEDDAEHNCSRVSSSFEEKDEDKNDVDVQKVHEQLSAEAHKSIASCLDELAECANDEEESGKKAEEHSIGSLMNTLAKRSTLNVDLDALRKNLIDSVSQAIESTLDSFVKQPPPPLPPSQHSVKHKSSDDELKRVEPAPKRIRVNEKIAKNSMNNSQNFNVSKILSKDTSKRKMPSVCDAFSAKPPLAHQSLLTAHNLNGKQAHLSTFYSAAAMSHLPPPPPGYNGLAAPIASSASSTASNASTNSSISSLFANHQHQLLMAAAHAHAASGQNSTNYLQMAAAANRLFTPYLLDQQHKPSGAYPPTSNGVFHSSSAHKRRRTKVTDTRLSPRNPLSRVLNGKTRDQSPNNDHDDDNDYDDEQHQHNQEDDSASSGCNESGSTNGSNCRITSTVYSNNVYDINTDNTEYTGYQISFLHK